MLDLIIAIRSASRSESPDFSPKALAHNLQQDFKNITNNKISNGTSQQNK